MIKEIIRIIIAIILTIPSIPVGFLTTGAFGVFPMMGGMLLLAGLISIPINYLSNKDIWSYDWEGGLFLSSSMFILTIGLWEWAYTGKSEILEGF